jgi:hypothetical protein
MLGRLITGETHSRALGKGRKRADFIVSNDAEWDTVFANTPATLSGKIVEVSGSNFTQRTITGKDMIAVGDPVVIRSANAASSIPSLLLDGITRGIDCTGLNFQMTGWPADYASCVVFNNGTFGAIRFNGGTSFRHGYGGGLANIDTSADLAEYDRVDNVQTATAASATYPLSCNTPFRPGQATCCRTIRHNRTQLGDRRQAGSARLQSLEPIGASHLCCRRV